MTQNLPAPYLNLGRLETDNAQSNQAHRTAALNLYQKLLRFEPRNPEANYQAATLLLWDAKYQQSLDHLAKLPAASQQQIGTQLLLCADHAALNHTTEANAAAAKLTAGPDLLEPDALEILPALRSAHRADLIEQIFAAANTHHPLSVNSLRTLGLAQEADGKLTEARATLEQVFAASPTSELVLVDLARVAKAAKDYQGALGYLAHARELKPNDASLPYGFGVICIRLSLLGEARKAMAEAVKLDPDNPTYNFGMGTISSFAQDPTGALPYLEKYHSLRPTDPAGTLSLGTTYFRAKNYDTAISCLTKPKPIRRPPLTPTIISAASPANRAILKRLPANSSKLTNSPPTAPASSPSSARSTWQPDDIQKRNPIFSKRSRSTKITTRLTLPCFSFTPAPMTSIAKSNPNVSTKSKTKTSSNIKR